VEMGDEPVAFELDRNVSDILEFAPEMDGAVGRDSDRLVGDDIVHDGQVVGGQVPDDVDVVLEKPQVDPDRVVEQKFAQLAGIDDLLDFLHGAGEEECVVDHDLEALLGRELDELLGLGARRGERLLDEDMFAREERFLDHLVMGEDRSDDGHGVHVRGPNEFQGVLHPFDEGIVVLRETQALVRNVADCGQLDPGRRMEIPGHIGPPVPVPDDTDINHDTRSHNLFDLPR